MPGITTNSRMLHCRICSIWSVLFMVHENKPFVVVAVTLISNDSRITTLESNFSPIYTALHRGIHTAAIWSTRSRCENLSRHHGSHSCAFYSFVSRIEISQIEILDLICGMIFRDPKYYPRPETFDPLRFTEEKRKVRHKALYLPFGGGPKVCMGLHFGHTQVKAAAMTIVREFMIKLSPEQKPVVQNPKSFQWHAKDGIYLTFEPRDKCKSN